MAKPKGGRGHKAPYESTHVRVPEPIKAEVDRLVSGYRESKQVKAVELEEVKALALEVLRQKKSARVSLEKLLTSLFGVDVDL